MGDFYNQMRINENEGFLLTLIFFYIYLHYSKKSFIFAAL
jgi:hypothetical protein